MQRQHPRWADPDTSYTLERCALGAGRLQPSGRIICDGCGAAAMAIDDIDHAPGCSQGGDR